MSFYSRNIVEHSSYSWRAAVSAIPPAFKRDHFLLGFLPDALYLPKSVLQSHAYIVGPSNSGKTSRVLVPLLAQRIQASDTVWVVDCKPDEMLLGHIDAECRAAGRQVRLFSMQPGLKSEFTLDLFAGLDLNPRTPRQIAQILIGSLGLGEAKEPFFISQNAGALTKAIEDARPKRLSFRTIAQSLAKVLRHEKRFEHAIHALDVLEELADVPALNDGPNRVSVAQLLGSGDVCYFCLPVTTELKMSCATAASLLLKCVTLASKDLALAGRGVARVYLAIDEFQEVAAAGDLADLLGQVRGIGGGVSLMLSHQVREQVQDLGLQALLQTAGVLVFLAPRSQADELQQWSGEKIVHLTSESFSSSWDRSSETVSYQETFRSALELNTIQQLNEMVGFGIAVVSGGTPTPIFFPHHVEFDTALRRGRGAFQARRSAPINPRTAGSQAATASPPSSSRRARTKSMACSSVGGAAPEPSVRSRIESLFADLASRTLVSKRSR